MSEAKKTDRLHHFKECQALASYQTYRFTINYILKSKIKRDGLLFKVAAT
jgi:hypothetical protein